MAIDHGYVFTRGDYASLIPSAYYHERTSRESAVIRDWLTARADEYDKLQFSVRIGTPPELGFEHLNGIKRMAWYALAKRIDILGWKGPQPDIIEVKERMIPGVLGQLQTYRHLLLEELPGIPEPNLIAVGRWCDVDTLRVLTANGVAVFLYAAG